MIINIPFSKTYKLRCPDGSIRIVHRNVDTACPLYIKSFQNKLKTEINLLKRIKGKISNDYQTKIEGVLVELNEMNGYLMMKYRSAYLLYQANPCQGYGSYSNETLKINDEHHKLMVLKSKIKGLIDLTGNNNIEALSLYKGMLKLIEDYKVVDTAIEEIEANRNIMKNLKGNKDGE